MFRTRAKTRCFAVKQNWRNYLFLPDHNSVAQVVRESSTARMTDITIPNISVVEGDSWKSVVDFVVIPRSTVMTAKGLFVVVFHLSSHLFGHPSIRNASASLFARLVI